MEYCVATFPSVHDALQFEKTLKDAGLTLQLIPVPREISSSCGIAAKFSPEHLSEFEKAIIEYQLTVDEIHVLKEKQKKKSLLNLLNN